MIEEITTDQLISLMKTKTIHLIDIRDDYSFSLGSIPNAQNIPSSTLLVNPDQYLKKDTIYYLFCNYGNSSKRVCEMLKSYGYHMVNIAGGYTSYLDSK